MSSTASSSAAKKFVPLVQSKQHRSLKKSGHSDEKKPAASSAVPDASIRKSEKKKKEKLLSALSASSEADKRKAMESGRIKFVGQELHMSDMPRLRASKCIVIGDNNTVLGDDNVLVGVNNKAIGEGNRLTAARREASSSVSRTFASKITAAVEAQEIVQPTPTPPQPPPASSQPAAAAAAAAAEANGYCSNDYWTLPDNWIIVNGVVVWRSEDIAIVLREYISMARVNNWNMQYQPRSITFEASLLLGRSAAFLELFGKYEIPYEFDARHAQLTLVAATTSGRIPMPPGMHQCRVRPTVGNLVIPLVDPDAPVQTVVPASIPPLPAMPARQPKQRRNAPVAPAVVEPPPPPPPPPPPAAAAAQPAQAPKTVKAASFMPKPGDPPEANAWLVSALDLPGAASKAGKDEPVCRVCMENRCDVLYEPCHHLIVCRECAIELQKDGMSRPNGKAICPTCRAPIKFYSIVFAGS